MACAGKKNIEKNFQQQKNELKWNDAVKISFWMCAFFYVFNFNFYSIFWALFIGRPNKNVIYTFSVVVSDLGSHTSELQSAILHYIYRMYVWARSLTHSWGNVQQQQQQEPHHHFFPLNCVCVLFFSLLCFDSFSYVFCFFSVWKIWSENYIFYILCTGWFLWLLCGISCIGHAYMHVFVYVCVFVHVRNVLFWLAVTTMDSKRIAW